MSEQMRKEFEAWREKSAFWQVVGEDVKDDPSSETASAGRMMSAAAWDAWQAALATQPQATPSLRETVAKVCEGWTLPDGARKMLETALFAQPQAPQGGVTKAQLEAAFEAEIAKVSHVAYDSNEICRHFFNNIRTALLAPTETPEAGK
jgi:hypothetical protein